MDPELFVHLDLQIEHLLVKQIALRFSSESKHLDLQEEGQRFTWPSLWTLASPLTPSHLAELM